MYDTFFAELESVFDSRSDLREAEAMLEGLFSRAAAAIRRG